MGESGGGEEGRKKREGQAVRILPRSSAGGSEGRRPVRLSEAQFNRHFLHPRIRPRICPESCLELLDLSKLGVP